MWVPRDQTQPGSFSQERKEPENEVGDMCCVVQILLAWGRSRGGLGGLVEPPKMKQMQIFWLYLFCEKEQ